MRNLYLALILILLCSCSLDNQIIQRKTLFVSILPQKYFLEKIVGDSYEIVVMVKPGSNPATYEPTPQQMTQLANSPLFFRIGVPFERAWLDEIRSVRPDLKIIDTRQNIKLRQVDSIFELIEDTLQETDQHRDDHGHGLEDPHIWLSPSLVKIQVKTMAGAMIDLDPDRRDLYLENLDNFNLELDSLSSRIATILTDLPSRYLMVFHPSWGYFADEFNLIQVPIESLGKQPGIRTVSEIVHFAQKHKIKTVFVQTQFSIREAEAVAEVLKARVIQIDPLAEDYYNNMLLIANTIKSELSR